MAPSATLLECARNAKRGEGVIRPARNWYLLRVLVQFLRLQLVRYLLRSIGMPDVPISVVETLIGDDELAGSLASLLGSPFGAHRIGVLTLPIAPGFRCWICPRHEFLLI